MPAATGPVPAWSAELALAYESGAHGQFILYGNVHDRLAMDGRLVNLAHYLEDELLGRFQVVFHYDLGNGLRVERGSELLEQWQNPVAQWPAEPLAAVALISHYLRYLANLRALGRGTLPHVAVIVHGVDQLLPADGVGYQHGSLAARLREWAGEAPFSELSFASLLIADNLNDLDPLVGFNPRVARINVPLPDDASLAVTLSLLRAAHTAAFPSDVSLDAIAQGLVGVTVAALESTVKQRAFEARALGDADWLAVKKAMVERDSAGLIEFVAPSRTLEDYHGQEALKTWLRQDIVLWRRGDLKALPMGYLFCGPVGTGKTFLVECLAGEAGVPVVKLKNFRDKWVGSSEGNLEKIFRLVRALGRCMVFIDEADQALGARTSGGSDNGLSGRLYAMIAQEMSDGTNRGRVMWIFASSRPDLIEVDLKRPGRIDVKVPLLPTASTADSAALLRTLGRRYGLDFTAHEFDEITADLPLLLTPGAAEALIVKAYRLARTDELTPHAALKRCLVGYQNPVPADVLEFQMRLAIREATDLAFVPESLRHFASDAPALA